MVNLEIRVFDSYTVQDILGEAPPANSKLRQKLESEIISLIKNLDKIPKPGLEEILLQHISAKQEITKFSGAMALDQSKIEMFHEFLTKYIKEIESRLVNHKN
ncbi:MAG: hypothetical protein JRZ94_04190 [Nitrososphaerota archaeon]|nr:hypothetical protein [Nitrososphaerota archaeon]